MANLSPKQIRELLVMNIFFQEIIKKYRTKAKDDDDDEADVGLPPYHYHILLLLLLLYVFSR